MEAAQWCNASGKWTDLLLDGAHNAEAARALALHIDRERARRRIIRVHWIIGMSGSKDVEAIVRALVRAGDHVECVAVQVILLLDLSWFLVALLTFCCEPADHQHLTVLE